MEPIQLKSKHIVLTGGTAGIGKELIKQLYSKNSISVIARPSNRLDELGREFDNIRVYEADLAKPESVAEAADKLETRDEPIDVLINNAAVQYTPHFLDNDFALETIEREIDTNLTSPAVLIYLTLPALLKSASPVIVNVNSGLGLVPKSSSAVYCATKGGLNILSQALANQFENCPIQISQVFLPLVDTKMTEGRGSGKISATEAASQIIYGIQKRQAEINIGKVKLLRLIMRISPSLARSIMKKG